VKKTTLPAAINSAAELDEILSRPSPALVRFMKKLDGDIMVLGAGGKIGPTMVRMARRAIDAAGAKKTVTAVDVVPLPALERMGVKTIVCDLMDLKAVETLPKVRNVIYMVGRKFGSTGAEHLTWAINVMVPYLVARAFTESRVVAFSTGCVYPIVHYRTGGASEKVAPDPVGEYAQSCLGRERMFDYFSIEKKEPVVQLRLNYAVELRYGVLCDVATKVWKGEPVDVTTGYANVIWQGDACNQILQALKLAGSPPAILNVTGPEIISIRETAKKFGQLFGKKPRFSGKENGRGYLSDASRAVSLFGRPTVSVDQVIRWIAHWIERGGESLGKPTHFETQNGKY
jgi:dTDP-4-dehydrorhamnose reductase